MFYKITLYDPKKIPSGLDLKNYKIEFESDHVNWATEFACKIARQYDANITLWTFDEVGGYYYPLQRIKIEAERAVIYA